ncbi:MULTISPECIES: bifunctional DNA primase/polymerase [unclassified Microcoleus]|uniref:bifunctional DNA primase/polymerase n=1 Tax=unclassified Microcoleus TaxID=2642155 RepID=UPI002FD104F0
MPPILTASTSLLTLPDNWILEPVAGKRPYRKAWTKTNVDRLFCLDQLETGRATGVGLKLGEGLLAIDVDGQSAAKLLQKFAGENGLAEFKQTVTWSSGRSGRNQYLFTVAEADWHRLRNLKILTGEVDADGNDEGLEFRWLGNQSVLPPSIHPTTQKPYYWVRSPTQVPTIQAPEWLLALCENWRPEYQGENELDLVRFPARLYQYFRRPLALWLLARRFDNSRHQHGGQNKGSGIGSFTLLAASRILNRSKDHIRKLLCRATKAGLLRRYTQEGDRITCYYTKFEKIAAIAGLKDLGPIAAINIDDLANLNILATEIEAQSLQKHSMYKKQEEISHTDAAETPARITRPSDLLHPCGIPARVLAKGDRFIYCDSGFAFYGGSQEGIGNRRGISTSTVGRHLSNRYRLEASPVQHKHSGVKPIIKKQLAERLPHLRGMPSSLCHEDGLFFANSDWFKPRCNVYSLNYRLISCKRRRANIKANDSKTLLNFDGRRGDLEHKSLLSMLSEELESHCQQKETKPLNQPER